MVNTIFSLLYQGIAWDSSLAYIFRIHPVLSVNISDNWGRNSILYKKIMLRIDKNYVQLGRDIEKDFYSLDFQCMFGLITNNP